MASHGLRLIATDRRVDIGQANGFHKQLKKSGVETELIVIEHGGHSMRTDVRVSKDPAAEFSGYRTFGFMRPLGTDRNGARTLLSGHLIEATTRELMDRGFTFDNTNPDLMVNFLSSTQTGIRTANQPVSARALSVLI